MIGTIDSMPHLHRTSLNVTFDDNITVSDMPVCHGSEKVYHRCHTQTSLPCDVQMFLAKSTNVLPRD